MSAAKLDETLSALADPTRRRVVDLLRKRPRRAGELASATSVSSPSMSRHLRVLRTRGLIEVANDAPDADARLRIYRLRRKPFTDLQSWLEQVESVWTEQLDAFKSHVERPRPRARR